MIRASSKPHARGRVGVMRGDCAQEQLCARSMGQFCKDQGMQRGTCVLAGGGVSALFGLVAKVLHRAAHHTQ